MRKSLAAIILSALIGLSSQGVRASSHDAIPLTDFADTFDKAQLTKDRAGLERMVADELVFIDGSGARRGKAEFIAGWTAAEDRYDPVVLEDRVVIPLGPDAGVVTAAATLSGTSGGKRFSSRFRFSDTFRRIRGQWQAVHIQVTRLAE